MKIKNYSLQILLDTNLNAQVSLLINSINYWELTESLLFREFQKKHPNCLTINSSGLDDDSYVKPRFQIYLPLFFNRHDENIKNDLEVIINHVLLLGKIDRDNRTLIKEKILEDFENWDIKKFNLYNIQKENRNKENEIIFDVETFDLSSKNLNIIYSKNNNAENDLQ